MERQLFSDKIKYLFNSLKLNQKEFVKLFWNGDIKTLNTRSKTVDNWLHNDIKQPKGFYFSDYQISTLLIEDSKRAFSKNSFMYDSFEEFQLQVDAYVAYKEQPEELFEYKYIYYFDANRKEITYAELNTIKKINNNEYIVELIPSAFYKNRGVEIYKGTLKIDKDYYHISVKNNFEILTFYFMLSKGYANHNKVNGIGLGLSYDKGLPLSTKDLLTKEKLSKEEELDFYLNANESEYLVSDNSLDNVYTDIKTNYLNKFHHKLSNLATFTTKSRDILSSVIDDDVYLNIFHKSFISLNEMSKKVDRNHKYFIARRRMATKIFLKSIATRENSGCYIVYPIFKNDSILFDKNDKRSKKLLDLNIYLSKNGLKIERIFVINKQYKMTKYFKDTIIRLQKAGVGVYMVFKEDIENIDIMSYDFVYSKEKDVAIYRNIQDRICYFQVTVLKDKIRNLSYDFEKIKEMSFKFDDFIENKDLINDKVLAQLVGTWNWYFYSSMEENEKVEIWNFTLKIESSGEVYFYNKKYKDLNFKGIIDTTYSSNQSFIKAFAKKSNNLTLIFIENRDIYKEVFKVSLLDKQRGIHRNMASFAIFSRVVLLESEIIKVLGEDVKETRFMEQEGFDKRINNLDMKVRKKKADKS